LKNQIFEITYELDGFLCKSHPECIKQPQRNNPGEKVGAYAMDGDFGRFVNESKEFPLIDVICAYVDKQGYRQIIEKAKGALSQHVQEGAQNSRADA
jgi:hypothetical protein